VDPTWAGSYALPLVPTLPSGLGHKLTVESRLEPVDVEHFQEDLVLQDFLEDGEALSV
jgi:hypothetical protein